MEDIHTLVYFGKGGYSLNPLELTGKERAWLIDRLDRQYADDEKAVEKAMRRRKY